MNFTVPIHITLNNIQQILTIHCSQIDNSWVAQSIKYPEASASSSDLQLAIKQVVDNVKTLPTLAQNQITSKEI